MISTSCSVRKASISVDGLLFSIAVVILSPGVSVILLYCGSWMTFQGDKGAGNWERIPVEYVLPVDILSHFNDRVEYPEGRGTTVVDTAHYTTQELGLDSLSHVYEYNETGTVNEDARLLAEFDDDQLLPTGEYGGGRMVLYSSGENGDLIWSSGRCSTRIGCNARIGDWITLTRIGDTRAQMALYRRYSGTGGT